MINITPACMNLSLSGITIIPTPALKTIEYMAKWFKNHFRLCRYWRHYLSKVVFIGKYDDASTASRSSEFIILYFNCKSMVRLIMK